VIKIQKIGDRFNYQCLSDDGKRQLYSVENVDATVLDGALSRLFDSAVATKALIVLEDAGEILLEGEQF